MEFDFNLQEYHKLCMDDGLVIRTYGSSEYALIKDEEDKYSLFSIDLDICNGTACEVWDILLSNKDWDKFKDEVVKSPLYKNNKII